MSIQLFNIPTYQIDTSKYNNLLHGSIVKNFENSFLDYVGGKYVCSINSATNAIFLVMMFLKQNYQDVRTSVPSMIPAVVCNALTQARYDINFQDDISWIGNKYKLAWTEDRKVIDSAQEVTKDQCKDLPDNDITIFSFYPTKPVGSCDGGIIISGDKDLIDLLKITTMNGMTNEVNNWDRIQKLAGWKMYLNSIQGDIALRNLKILDEKKEKLAIIRNMYNKELGLNNTSDHLYRIEVKNNIETMNHFKTVGITTGIHYRCQHKNPLFNYGYRQFPPKQCPLSEVAETTTLSIPFHEAMSTSEVEYVIREVKNYRRT